MFDLSKRWEMILLLLSGVTVVYTLRVNMSVAAQTMRDDLDWSESQKGFVLVGTSSLIIIACIIYYDVLVVS
jgi:hypothetical protein